MSIQLERHRFVSLSSSLMLAIALATACSDQGSDAADGATGGDGGSEPGRSAIGAGGSDEKGGAGGAAAGPTSAECPLDEEQRSVVEAEFQQASSAAWWIVNQSHGSGMFAGRGFGFAVPFTTTAALFSATLMQACEGENAFEEYCSPPTDPEQGVASCSQLKCLESGVLQTTMRLDPLPITLPAEPPPGEVALDRAEHLATFTENADGSVSIEWSTDLELTLPDGTSLVIGETGDARVGEDGPERNGGQVTIEGLHSEPVVIDYETSGEETTGEGTVSGAAILEVTHDGLVWLGSCDPGS